MNQASLESAPATEDCEIVELRQYTLHPDQREVLIELFDREFLESQEAVGMCVIGQFRDLDDPNRFVWLRGFADMESRRKGLEAFYFGPVWGKHRDIANATMVDSDNVLLLKPAWSGSTLKSTPNSRPPVGTSTPAMGLVDIAVFNLKEPADMDLLAFVRNSMTQSLYEAGAREVAWYVTDTSENTFPRLPVREGEHVLVGVVVFDHKDPLANFLASGVRQKSMATTLAHWLAQPSQLLKLQPTERSALHA
ncbi:NIPSNAP family protein [Dyella acidisoli]|uniref:NIPSNAP family containing protein n=1 Tax=Dyella acidisoli TaxID=1867834 RepID=A0ABQ5XS22_9GAMM|nr:NIPSNAP family protein [Dyella acidisoli]GLQ94383.1 NIPSNAP family containing protein [Dyella acidisoli]